MSTPGNDPASLQNLHDIVPPAAVPWWPPATGWTVLAGILAVGLLVGTFLWLRRYQRNRYRRAALSQLRLIRLQGESDTGVGARELSGLLKRTALAAWPREQVATLSGSEWLNFLQQSMTRANMGESLGRSLQETVYQRKKLPLEEFEAMCTSAEDWIRLHRSPVN